MYAVISLGDVQNGIELFRVETTFWCLFSSLLDKNEEKMGEKKNFMENSLILLQKTCFMMENGVKHIIMIKTVEN